MATQESGDFQFGKWLTNPLPGEEVVVTGMSGRLPASRNIQEFKENLFNKVDMVTEKHGRWDLDHPEIPKRLAAIKELDKIDAGFFGIHHRAADILDVQNRIFMEVAVEAVLDAGLHPSELAGTKTGVYIGASCSEAQPKVLGDISEPQKFGLPGYLRSMIAHRVSYFLKLKGPSCIVDTACSSSANALEHAYKAIRSGECDNALVGGSNVMMHPGVTLQFFRLGVLSNNGTCKVFDQEASGYVRGDTIACAFLQKAKNSRRIYAQLVHAKINDDGYKDKGITFPSAEMQMQLMTEVCEESGISPSDLTFLEAHGTGTVVGDPQEVEAIDSALGKKRKTPLFIGSVKCSVGHTEPSSCFCSMIKVLIALDTGIIPPNIHLNKIREGLKGFEEGRLIPVTEAKVIEDEKALMGINNFGFGGNNCHLLVRRHNKNKLNRGLPKDDLPRLVLVSGRTEEAVFTILGDLNKRSLDEEYVALLHQIFKKNINGHFYRGYTLLSKNGTIKSSIKLFLNDVSPFYIHFGKFDNFFWIVGKYFMNFPIFKNTMLRINKILINQDLNVINIIQRGRNKHVDKVLGAVAVQLGIVNLIKELELNPTRVLGSSLGKIACAYYHQIFTIEESIAAALTLANHSILKINPEQVFPEMNIFNNEEDFYNKDPSFNFSDGHMKDPTKILEMLGRLYELGYNPQLHKLYPSVQFPVSRNTPMISPLIKWNHDKSWYTFHFTNFTALDAAQNYITISQNEYSYVTGHVIDGRNLFPATGYLLLVWETLARSRRLQIIDFPVVFENCKFVKAITLPKNVFTVCFVNIAAGTGNFEIFENDSLIVSGRIYFPNDITKQQSKLSSDYEETDLNLDQDDIYKELHLRGYNYSDLFKGILKCNNEASSGLIRWDNNWVTFMDNMLQMKILNEDTRHLYVPVGIKKLTIDPLKHLNIIEDLNQEVPQVPVHVYRDSNIIKSGAIEICGLQASAISRRKHLVEPILEKYTFVQNDAIMASLSQIMRVNTQIIMENSLERNIRAVEIIDDFTKTDSNFLLPLINDVLEDIPLATSELIISAKNVSEKIVGVVVEPVTINSSSNLLLIVASKILQRPSVLEQLLGGLGKKGFILGREDPDFIPNDINGIEILTQFSTETEKLILFKKSERFDSTKCIEVTSQHFDWITELQKAIKADYNVIVYSQNDETEGILGLVNCLRQEPGGDKIKCFFILDKDAPPFNLQNNFYSNQINKNLAINVYKNSKWGTYRHVLLENIKEIKTEYCYCAPTVKGDLSSFKWIEGPVTENTPLNKNQVLVYPHFSALNFRDVMTASGRITLEEVHRIGNECCQGMEFSGKDSTGRRVMGMVSGGALATFIAADSDLLCPIPENWSYEDAATVPVVYFTVIYAILMRTNLKPGTSILIHSATGGVGIAALNIALHFRCNIFVTVGTQEKRDFLKKNFPQILESHIGNSRDTSFEEMIKIETNGQGVDVVLNSLAEDKLNASVRCLARGGRFMEIGKFDLINDNNLHLLFMEKEASYHGVMLDRIMGQSNEKKIALTQLISKGIEEGYVKPLPRVVFKENEIETAFRYMTTGKHIGKVLIKMREENENYRKLLTSVPKFYCNPEKTYIIVGGLGGFGLELADWLVLRRAKKLILTSRSGIQTGYQAKRVEIWKSYGISVHIFINDITSKQGCENLIKEANKLGAVDGIFNLAAILQDALFEDQNLEKFKVSLAPKAGVTRYLDEVTRKICPDLRYFVVFSSVSCGRGNAGQTNYGMANSIMERICEKRHDDGLPALAIQWGAIGDVGLVAKMQKDNRELVIGGTLQQRISNCLEIMDTFLKQKNPVVASMVVAEKQKKSGSGSAVEAVAGVLGIKDFKTVSPHSTLPELGMDSMMGTEIIQLLEKDFEIYVTAKDVRSLTLTKLADLEAEKNVDAKDEKVNKIEQGSKTMLQYIPDSDISEKPIIELSSQIKASHKTTVFVFPGVEGVLKLLDPLTTELNAHVLGVQYSYRNPEDSIEETAKTLLPHIEKHLVKNKPFFFIGYSFGVIFGLEIIKILESKGYSGKFIAIDGSPHYTTQIMRQYASGETEAEFQTMLLYNILAVFLPIDILIENKEKLMKCETFEERTTLASSLIPSNLANRNKLEQQAAVTLYKRFKASFNYNFGSSKIKSPVKLYRAKFAMVSDIEEDYKLSELCENVEVSEVDGDHLTIVTQSVLHDEINEMLQCIRN